VGHDAGSWYRHDAGLPAVQFGASSAIQLSRCRLFKANAGGRTPSETRQRDPLCNIQRSTSNIQHPSPRHASECVGAHCGERKGLGLNRYAINGVGLDDPPFQDGDGGFLGVNDRLAPELLPEGWVAGATNLEFVSGELRTRRGFVSPLFVQTLATLRGAGVFRDPNGSESVVLVGRAQAFFCREGRAPRAVDLPSTLATDETVSVRQAFDRLFLFREGAVPWEFTGLGAFAEVDRSVNTGDGTHPIALAATAELLNDRLYVPDGDYLNASDIADYTRFAIGNRQRFNSGTADTIVRVFAFTQNTLLVFKGKSVLALTGAIGNLSGARVELINPEIGCLAPESVGSVGADALFLSSRGVYRVQQIVESRLGTAPTAVSQDIPGLMRRVNWKSAAGAQAVVQGDYYYLAVPIDGSTTNNAIVSYNLVTGAWEGVHTYGIRIDRLIVATVRGQRRVLAVDFQSGSAHLLYEQESEDLYAPLREESTDPEETPEFFPPDQDAIATEVVTRGYRAENAGRKRFRVVQLDSVTRGASVSAELRVDGNAEREALWPVTIARSRTANIDGSTWDSTNAGDDHGAAGREDYAVVCPFQCGSGIVLSREQSFTDRFSAMARGRVGQVRISTTRGMIGIRAIRIEGTQIDRSFSSQI
jgi:hypothetical protein